jgi:hypothetical protein
MQHSNIEELFEGFKNRLWDVPSRIFCKNEPPILGGHNFLASSSFLPIFSVTNAPKGGLHLLFGHHEQ